MPARSVFLWAGAVRDAGAAAFRARRRSGHDAILNQTPAAVHDVTLRFARTGRRHRQTLEKTGRDATSLRGDARDLEASARDASGASAVGKWLA